MAKQKVAESTRRILEGHAALRARMARSLRDGRAAHAYLISGPEGVGKAALAIEFARLLLCDNELEQACENCPQCEASRPLQHPDLSFVYPLPPGVIKTRKSGDEAEEIDESGIADKLAELTAQLALDPFAPTKLGTDGSETSRARLLNHSVRIPQIRALLRQVARKTYQAKRKAYMIFHAETMNVQAQNALLKALEEPPPNGYFLLIAENDSELLPTIRSRCQLIHMGKLDGDIISSALQADGVPAKQAHIAAQLANGSFVRARALAEEDLSTLQDDVVFYLAESARCNPLELPAAIERVQNRLNAADRSYFDFLNLFLRDAALYGSLAEDAEDQIVFAALQPRIQKVVQAYPHADFEAAMQAVDQSAEFISLGYTPDLVLNALAIRIHNALGPLARRAPAPQTG